ncbi:PREDICTED: uncharacterized protein At5g43822 [Tarenaya hassleriana]|uniref:uncharacterized protein At5g43822 n=1 Tax=Tarenaya hassleriana TaxID=28532 RepID=UPI00053C1FE5|nr:PREDICTED: uncharacterized protein At5g43822 [Tarenaya hassleriana]
MEAVIKKYQQKFRKAQSEMEKWEAFQLRFVSLFRNASSIILRLHDIQDSRCYGVLKCISEIEDAVLKKQMDQLETLLLSMRKILEEFRVSALAFEKLHRDAAQLVKTGSNQLSKKQLQHRIGVNPCIEDCLNGLYLLYDMHRSEYLLKSSLFSSLSHAVVNSSPGDLTALQQLVVDQPNIQKEEVQHIFDIIFAGEIT